jgi:hypothetical protein
MIWSRSAPVIERRVLMRLKSEAVCIRIHMFKNEARIIHLQRKERSLKKTFFMSVHVFSKFQTFRPKKVYLPKVKLLYSYLGHSVYLPKLKLLYSYLGHSVYLRYNESDT